jgi:ubiquinone/menaquinone biosynthesis C-methylase UbiE
MADLDPPAVSSTFGLDMNQLDRPSILDIPDLRTREDLYMPNDQDTAQALKLADAYEHCDFHALLELYFDLNPEIDGAQRRSQLHHITTADSRAARWLEAIGTQLPDGPILDLGCGSGSSIETFLKSGREVVGIDVAMRWLMIASKRLEQNHCKHVRLYCGNAEALPFPDGEFAAVIAGDVIEHVTDAKATIAEAYRVLKPGGVLFMATPNRFSLAMEPHVKLWGVGFLPRPWMSTYVKMLRHVDFRAIHTRGFNGWQSVLKESPFESFTIRSPSFSDSEIAGMTGIKRKVARLYNRLLSRKSGQFVMNAVGPLFHIIAKRS